MLLAGIHLAEKSNVQSGKKPTKSTSFLAVNPQRGVRRCSERKKLPPVIPASSGSQLQGIQIAEKSNVQSGKKSTKSTSFLAVNPQHRIVLFREKET